MEGKEKNGKRQKEKAMQTTKINMKGNIRKLKRYGQSKKKKRKIHKKQK